MRQGAEFIKNSSHHYNLNFIVLKLEKCCDDFGGRCDGCPDIVVCTTAYDDRCSWGGNTIKQKNRAKT